MEQHKFYGKVVSYEKEDVPVLEANMDVEIIRYIKALVKSGHSTHGIEQYLLDHGKKLEADVLTQHPILLPWPERVPAPYECHRNSLQYAGQLMKSLNGDDSKLKFFAGMYRISAINDLVPPTRRCVISCHSCLLYEEKIYDTTILQNPPKNYEVTQYFGVTYPLMQMIEEILRFAGKKRAIEATPLFILKNIIL